MSASVDLSRAKDRENKNSTANKPVSRRRSNVQRSAETRSALIESVIEGLCEVGYAKTTTHEISRRAKATTGAMQHHFGSKDELILASLDRLFSEIKERLEAEVSSKGPIVDRCRDLMKALWHNYYGQQRYVAVWEVVVGSRAEPVLHEKVIQHRMASLEALQEIWNQTFAAEVGSRSSDALHFTLSHLRGAALFGLVDQSEEFIDRQLQYLSETVVQMLAGGDGKRP